MKAYAQENKGLEESKLEGKARTQWQYQRFVKDYLRCVDAVDENVGRMLDYLLARSDTKFMSGEQICDWFTATETAKKEKASIRTSA